MTTCQTRRSTRCRRSLLLAAVLRTAPAGKTAGGAKSATTPERIGPRASKTNRRWADRTPVPVGRRRDCFLMYSVALVRGEGAAQNRAGALVDRPAAVSARCQPSKRASRPASIEVRMSMLAMVASKHSLAARISATPPRRCRHQAPVPPRSPRAASAGPLRNVAPTAK